MQKDCVMLTTDPTFAYFTYLFYFYFLPIKYITSQNDSLVPNLPAKTKDLLVLAENSWKTEIKLFLLCAISHEN